MKMRQIQFDGVGELHQVEREIPPLKDTQVLVKEMCIRDRRCPLPAPRAKWRYAVLPSPGGGSGSPPHPAS